MMIRENGEYRDGMKQVWNLRHRGGAAIIAVTVLVLLIGARTGKAGMIVDMVVEDSTPSGSTGAFDVVLRPDSLSSPGSSTLIGGFAVDVAVPSGSGVSFTGIDTNTAIPYIFSGTSSGFLVTTDTATEVAGNDLSSTSGTQMTAGGSSFGLIHVTYSVTSGAGGVFPVILSSFGSTLSDDQGNVIPLYDGSGRQAVSYRLINGLIINAVPEPTSLVLVALGLIGLPLAFGRLSRKSSVPS